MKFSCPIRVLPPFVKDLRSELPQRVAAPQLEALITETLQRVEVITVNLLVVPIGKRYFNPGAMAPLVYAALYLEEAQFGFSISCN